MGTAHMRTYNETNQPQSCTVMDTVMMKQHPSGQTMFGMHVVNACMVNTHIVNACAHMVNACACFVDMYARIQYEKKLYVASGSASC